MSAKEDSSQNPHENQKILCTMHIHGTQGGPCQVFGRIGQTPWVEHSLQESADLSIVVGANRLGILVYIDCYIKPAARADLQISLGKTRHVHPNCIFTLENRTFMTSHVAAKEHVTP